MAENNDLQQGLQDSYSGVKDAANSAKNAARTAKKTVGTAKKAVKKGKAAAKGAKKLFAFIPLPIKLYIAAGLGIAVFFGGLLYFMPSLISNSLLHQNDPESVSSGVDFSDNKNSEESYAEMEDKAGECREMIIDKLNDGKTAAYNDLVREAQRHGWKLDTSSYSEPPEQSDNQNMVLIYSGYSVSTKNGLGDSAFEHYQGDSTDQVEGLTAYNDLTKMLDNAVKTKNSTHPFGNLMHGSDFERDSNGEIKKKEVKEGLVTVTYVFPVVYDTDIEELIEKGILPDGVTLDSVYENTSTVGKSTTITATNESEDTSADEKDISAAAGTTDGSSLNLVSGIPYSPKSNVSDNADLSSLCNSLGNFKITRYCPCFEENGNSSGLAANGEPLQPGVTIAVDPKVIPLGSAVYIKGIGWRKAQDTGSAIKGHIIDLLVPDHHTAETVTTYNDVYVAKDSSGITFGDDITGGTDGSTGEGVTYRDTMNEMAATLGHMLFPDEAWVDSIGLGSSYGEDGLGYFGAMWYWIQYETGRTTDDAFWYFTQDDGQGGQAYGIQYDLYKGSLQEFIKYCVKQDAAKYAMFKPYLTASKDSLYAHSASDPMPTAWKAAYSADPEGFKSLQKEYAAANYLDPVVKYLEKKEYKIDSRSDVVKGLMLGWAFQWGPATPEVKLRRIGTAAELNKLSDMDFLKTVYDWRIKNESKFADRYTNEKKTALALQKEWDSGGGILGVNGGKGKITAAQAQKVASLASTNRSFGLSGAWCLSWVQSVYRTAGVTNENVCCAGHARRKFAIKIPSSAKEIPVGAAVFSNPKVYVNKNNSNGSTKYCHDQSPPELQGHVGIYVGNGKVRSWLGSSVGTDTWEHWCEWYGNGGYGIPY